MSSTVAQHICAGALVASAFVATACSTHTARAGVDAPAPRADAAPSAAAPSTAARSEASVPSGAHTMNAADFDRAGDAPNALAAIERVRPLFLRPRPSFGALRNQAPVISVFINGAYAGGPDALRVIGPAAVASARFLQPSEAV